MLFTRSNVCKGRPCIASVVMFGVLASGGSPALASNDSLETPTALAYNSPQTLNTLGYTTQGAAEPGLGGNLGCPAISHTAWYTIQGTGGQATVTTAGSDYDTVLYAYTGSALGALIVCGDDDPSVVTSTVSFPTVVSATYAIQAAGKAADSGTLHIAASNTVLPSSPPPPPAPPPPPPPPIVAPDYALFATSPKSLRVSKTGRFTYSFVATPGRSGIAKLTSTKSIKIGAKKRQVKLAAKTFTAPTSGKVKVKLKLSAKNLAALEHRTSLQFKVTVTVTAKTFTTKVKLKPPRAA